MIDSVVDVGKPSEGAIESLFCRTMRIHNDVVIPSVKTQDPAVAPPSSMGMLGCVVAERCQDQVCWALEACGSRLAGPMGGRENRQV